MIWLVRHGETEWNREGRFQGRLDSPLTALGRAQAERVGRLLAAEFAAANGPVAAHVSPLGRARATAELIGRHVKLEVVVDPRLAEVGIGDWDGLTMPEIEAGWPGVLDGAGRYDWFFRAPQGEALEAACERLAAWLAEVRTPVVAICHGLAGRLLRGLYLGLGPEQILGLADPHLLDGGIPQDRFYRLADGRIALLGGADGAAAQE